MMAPKLGFEYSDDAMNYLLQKHYRDVGRHMRCCHPRDLLMQVRNMCRYEGKPLDLSTDSLDFAVENYFAVV
jgi:hypothetical protein